jgi:hypothetical protein
MWTGGRYVWRAGYWTRVRPGYIYVSSHYRWTPNGHVFVAGYWDYAVSRRGVLYAPITVNVALVGPRYVYTPYYAVRDTIVLDTLFVRPAYGAYYFGDYYGPRYVSIGFEPVVVYSRRHHDPIIVYERWVSRVTLVIARGAGRAPVPPRTLVQQRNVTNITNVKNVTNVTNVTNVIAPTRTVVAATGAKTVPLDANTRSRVRNASQQTQQTLSADRHKAETGASSGRPMTKPRTAPLKVQSTPPASAPAVTKKGPIGNPKTAFPDPKTGRGSPFADRKGPPPRPMFDNPPRDGGKKGPTIRPPMKRPPDEKRKKGR